MGDQTFSVDPEGLREPLARIREIASDFQGIGTGLTSRLAAIGPCWGDDESGRQFYEVYGGPRDELLQGFSAASELVNQTADGIDTMSRNYRALEDQNIAHAQSLNSGGDNHLPTGGSEGGGHESKPAKP
ncbi:WXG100 family type VII secretion target [Kitasatospora sp. NPDC052896]|uniref:WXG100 family type VII secretion target n=1 Tax=Kitasatospora sp. NPDC052896 TaxID=3364061 RepID=UPI0037C6A677